jgi:predicted kinase
MLELILLIGLQASGKSTFRRERLDATHVVVSKDLMRNNRRPARRQRELIERALSEGRSVVVDNTNPRLEERAELVALGRQYGARVTGYFFPCSVQASIARNNLRVGREHVPRVGIFATAKAMRVPTHDEGFDILYRVTRHDEGAVVLEVVGETSAGDNREER